MWTSLTVVMSSYLEFNRVERKRMWLWNAEGMMLQEFVMLIMLMGKLSLELVISFGRL